ncbi:MAG: S9 family peptidase [Alphaproteobacteria bacterium]|nr:S9 family peptidase [Alphaproteobacteria bacterium]MDI9635773.1 S9 family peptidase [Geitlerinema splendidum]
MTTKRIWKLRGHAFLLQIFFCFAYSPCVAEKENATAPLKPLWTPEECVTLPEETVKDISSDGKYTLIMVDHTSLENKKGKKYSTCVLVNNETLAKETIGELNHSCTQPQFIGKGQFFSYIMNDTHGEEETSALFVQEISSKKQTKVQNLEEGCQEYTFAPDGKSFAFLTNLYFKQDDNFKTVLGFQKVSQNFQPIDPPLYKSEFNLYNPFDSSFYQWSPDSHKVAFVATTLFWKSEPKVTLYLLDLAKDKLTEINNAMGYIGDLAFSPDSQKLAFIKEDGYGKQKTPLKPFEELEPDIIQVVDLKTGKTVSIDAVDIGFIVGWTENNKALIVTKHVGTKSQLYSLDIETKKLTLMEVPNLTYINNANLSSNSKYIGFSGENLHQPSATYISDMDSFSPKKISDINEKKNLTAIKATPITWKSYDGLEIEGVLTTPQGYTEGQKVPLIVSIHGGPESVESQQFIGKKLPDPFSPAVFASQGYATLVVNYRGSRGYGEKFQNSNYKDLGGGDYKDIITGVDFLINKGIADSDQLFIRGPSYGGFLTAWAIGHTNRFKAAIVVAGPVDWISDIATTDLPPPMAILFGEAYWENYELWRESSPIRYVSHIETPTLIIQGMEDKRVPITQSLQLYNALKARKIPTRLVYYDGQGHGFTSPVALRDAMNETLTWLKTYGGKKELMDEKKEK